ncbi:MAG: sulfite exporter TauE/SafE family protein, partial [Aequorivita sp.]|nr:sulfite exporter TauE/SafE family protein [Aequorivita sp.]
MMAIGIEPTFFLILLFVVAFLYSSVGHGGASGYLALMAIFGIMAPSMMKSSALIMNIFVSSISFFHYYRSGNFRWKLFLPFAIASIPLAFIGGYIILDTLIYKKILG